ncbi:kinesin-like protein NACK1 isoform X1 [Prunus yedoensis var. nudiflora]|uniref:Kinesin-like protein n=1 Tax=Prunus yedoensis var. nudiflora TaxID=2094558 RepID=A0A314UPI0_PRUYE|nr:kinesin-like protein NACK1 isoform X1 [Prunus yedoensis var. nudiflora]
MALEQQPMKEEKILVSVRLRPLNQKEKTRSDVSDWCVKNNTLMYNNSHPDRPMSPSAYSFDRVFGWECPTRKVYDEGAKEVALSAINGINSTIFAYGQTSSGKTYTMKGITDYAITDIYDYIEQHSDKEFVLKFSAMEIYNEVVKDLLSSDSGPLRLLDDPEKGTVIEKLSEEILRDQNHLQELLSICEAQRKIGETSLNETSSRSHQILRLTIESSAREYLGIESSSTLAATVNFVDLAGSERVSQALSAGARLKEGCHINRSLLTLGGVIRKLSKGRNGHVPYRDSKLTRILQNSLGGNARTAIICTMSPARSHVEQSKNTLFFASCAKEVSTNAKVNVVTSDKALVKQLQKELAKMEGALTSLTSKSMQEKELLLEQMDKEIKELTHQRDLAQSRVQNLLQSVGEGRAPRIGENSGSEESLDMGVKAYKSSDITDRPSLPNSRKHNRQLSESSDEFFLLDGSTPQFVGLDPCQGWEDIAQKSLAESEHFAQTSHTEPKDITQRCHAEPEDIAQRCHAESEDIAQRCRAEASSTESEASCKEIRCISSMDQNTFDSFLPGSEVLMHEDVPSSSQTVPMQEDAASSSQTGDKELNHVNAEYEAMRLKIQELQRTINNLVTLAPIGQSPSSSESSSISLGMSRSRSCRAVVMSPSSFASNEAEQKRTQHLLKAFHGGPADQGKVPTVEIYPGKIFQLLV